MRAAALCVLFLAFCLPGWCDEPGAGEFDFGFVASRYRDAGGELRFKVLGPFVEAANSEGGASLWAVRPLFSGVYDPVAERLKQEYLWPVGAAKAFKTEREWRILLLFYLDYDFTDPHSRYHARLLPIYFQGRDIHKQSYFAIFPLGGSVHDFLGRDEINFFLFPLWDDNRINEVRTRDILWPIYSRTVGDGIYRFRVFPFYGRSMEKDRMEKRFLMWPFWTWAHYKFRGSYGTGYVVWPLWGHIDLSDQKTWFFLPPLIRFSWGQQQNYGYCPWPFVQWSSGRTRKFYLWPLWGHKTARGIKSSFFLWPVFYTERIDRGDQIGQRFLAMPIVQSEIRTQREKDAAGRPVVVSRYHKVWPLLSYQQEGADRRFRFLELWPLRSTGPVERSWAPLWTLYSHTGVGPNVDDELLWGLARRRLRDGKMYSYSVFPVVSWQRDRRAGDAREWSLFKGLLGYRRDGTQKSFRVLYFLRFGGKEKPS